MIHMSEDFEVLFEVRIRLMKKPTSLNAEEDKIRFILKSLAVSDDGVDIYLYLKKHGISTPEDISKNLGKPLENVIENLDYLYSLGLIEKLGRGYFIEKDISVALRRNTVKKITDILDRLAEILEKERGDEK